MGGAANDITTFLGETSFCRHVLLVPVARPREWDFSTLIEAGRKLDNPIPMAELPELGIGIS